MMILWPVNFYQFCCWKPLPPLSCLWLPLSRPRTDQKFNFCCSCVAVNTEHSSVRSEENHNFDQSIGFLHLSFTEIDRNALHTNRRSLSGDTDLYQFGYDMIRFLWMIHLFREYNQKGRRLVTGFRVPVPAPGWLTLTSGSFVTSAPLRFHGLCMVQVYIRLMTCVAKQIPWKSDIFQGGCRLHLPNMQFWWVGNKLASLGATLVRNYDPLTHLLTDRGKV